MTAKSLGTLPVIYAVDEQKNPLPRKTHETMLCGVDTNSTGRDGGRKFLPLHGCSEDFWQTLYKHTKQNCLKLIIFQCHIFHNSTIKIETTKVRDRSYSARQILQLKQARYINIQVNRKEKAN